MKIHYLLLVICFFFYFSCSENKEIQTNNDKSCIDTAFFCPHNNFKRWLNMPDDRFFKTAIYTTKDSFFIKDGVYLKKQGDKLNIVTSDGFGIINFFPIMNIETKQGFDTMNIDDLFPPPVNVIWESLEIVSKRERDTINASFIYKSTAERIVTSASDTTFWYAYDITVRLDNGKITIAPKGAYRKDNRALW